MKLNKIFKWGMFALIVISVAILVWGFITGFEANDGFATDVLLNWAYIMVGIAIFSWVIIGLVVSIQNNPKSLIKIGLILVGAAAICLVAYLLAPANPAVGREGLDTVATLKLTDTLLNLTYFFGAGAIVAIIVGEIRMSIASKK